MSTERSRATEALRTALGTDHGFYARFYDIWREPRAVAELEERAPRRKPRSPVSMKDAAWELGVSEGKVAVTMKYAVKQGYFRVTTPRTEQACWEPTEKGIALFEQGVMPAVETLVTPGRARVTPMTESEARDDDGWIPIEEVRRRADRRAVTKKDEPFKGYLPPPNDE